MPVTPTPLRLSLDDVRRAMQRPLPGLAAQLGMLPQRPRGSEPAGANQRRRPAAVLILAYTIVDNNGGVPTLVLTRRTQTVQTHKGQISLPGGAHEGHESMVETALREAHEELGVSVGDFEVLGTLTPLYVGVSDYLITPVVAVAPGRPDFRPDPVEVVDVIEVPLVLLLDPSVRAEEDWEIRGSRVHVPYFALGANKVWGATAMILAEFAAVLQSATPA